MGVTFRLPFALLLLAAVALPAAAIEIGDAPSLPWEGEAEYGLRLDYDRTQLPKDLRRLLKEESDSLLVRYETLRRASEYVSERGGDEATGNAVSAAVSTYLWGVQVGRKGLTKFDYGCWRALVTGEPWSPSAKTRAALEDQAAKLAYVVGRLDPRGGLSGAALDEAEEGSLLARIILRDFDHEYETLAALRASFEPKPPGTVDFGFPQPPPIPDANPELRHGVTLLAPWRLVLRRGEDGLEVTWPKETPWRVRVLLGHRLIVGSRVTYQVFVDGESVAAHWSEGLHGGEPIHAASGASFYQDVPSGSVVRATVEIFETDIPGQHLWSPTGGRYRVLWTHTYEATAP